MKGFDFDLSTQEVFNKFYSFKKNKSWRDWLSISNEDEYLQLCLENSGLHGINDLKKKIETKKTNSREFSIDLESFLDSYHQIMPPILCHTSGTTNNDPSALKWFHMSESVIKNLWIPGMRAIFESSGLNSQNSAIIFVPSRMKFDGINYYNEKKYVSLYSSEFSQRLVLSQLKPKSYLLHPYKDVFNLDVLAEILSLNDVGIISAPAATILKWADFERLKSGIKNYLAKTKKEHKKFRNDNELLKIIDKEGLDAGARVIQDKISKRISDAVLIFSISSLNEEKWQLIRNLMNWKKGEERFTNLYVASEIGPFASSLPLNNFEISKKNQMYILPLTLPAIDYRGKIRLINEIESKQGKLLVSRMNQSTPLFNIDTGDVISVIGHNSLPLIKGDILRGEFNLKYQIKIIDKIKKPSNGRIKAGNFIVFDDFQINNTQKLLNCINKVCKLNNDSLLLINTNSSKWKLFIPLKKEKCNDVDKIKNIFFNCPNETQFKKAMEENKILIDIIDDQIIDFLEPKSEVLRKVREGIYPKGILKTWPLYVVESK